MHNVDIKNMHNVNIKHPERDALWADSSWDPFSTLHSRFSILPEKNNQDIGPNQAECHWTTKWGLNLRGAINFFGAILDLVPTGLTNKI